MNLELLVNAFNTNAINLENAEIYDLQNDKMTLEQLEELLTLHNQYSNENFQLRYSQIKALNNVEESLKPKVTASTEK
jgi:hypothetical protein